MSYQHLSLSMESPVATLELRRAEQMNAFDEALHTEFAHALGALRLASDVRVIVISAAGRYFSAGGNFDYIRRLRLEPELRRRALQDARDIFALLMDMPVPLVVAMQGHAIGLGATIVTSCDVVVAWRHAKLGDPHVHVGILAADGGTISWTAAAGLNRARRLLLTGDSITAEQAYQFGLVTDLVDTPDAALPEAMAIATRIAALPPIAVQGTKRAFNPVARNLFGNALDVALAAQAQALESEDLKEALDALAEKRQGQFSNR